MKVNAGIKDVASFLNTIGRNTVEFQESFPSFQDLLTTNSKKMKASGVDIKARKYIMYQLENYRQGRELQEIKVGVKKNGGERKFQQHIAKKNILNKIEQAKHIKLFKKETKKTTLEYLKLDQMHEKAGHKL